jgi:hypothetical protein
LQAHLLKDVDISQIVVELFQAAGVTRVVSVDDMYADETPVEDVLGLCDALGPSVAASVFEGQAGIDFEGDADIRRAAIRSVWLTLEASKRRDILQELRAKDSPEDDIDKGSKEALGHFFGQYQLTALSLAEWRERQAEFISSEMPLTLFLFDEDFSRENGSSTEGLNLVKAAFAATNTEKLLCALLSHKYSVDGIHDQWKKVADAEGFDKSRFVLIPKGLLDDEPIAFARLIKLAILNGSVEKLKKKAGEIIKGAENSASKLLNGVDIYDFDQIVFRSSAREGVWEPDTLFRVFGLFLRDETRKLAKSDADLHAMAAHIRSISQIATDSPSAPDYETWKVQRVELYEDADYLNPYFMPIELGDVFEKTTESKTRFILLSQSCDLMVRADGNRHHGIREGMLAEIVLGLPRDLNSHAELTYFDEEHSKRYFVNFKKTFAVKLFALDLCAFNPKGEAMFSLGSKCPETAIPTWKTHYEAVAKTAEKVIRRFPELTKTGLSEDDATTYLMRCSNEKLFGARIMAGKSLSYNFRRVARLRQPRAAALLARYAGFVAREAFDHDFGVHEERTSKKSMQAVPGEVRDDAQQVAIEPHSTGVKQPGALAIEPDRAMLPENQPKNTSPGTERT